MSFKYEKPLYRPNKKKPSKKPRPKRYKNPEDRALALRKQEIALNKSWGYKSEIEKSIQVDQKILAKRKHYKASRDTSEQLPKESPVSDTEKRRLARKAAQESEARKEAARQRLIEAEYQAYQAQL
jgi:hypothetical protein